LEKAFDNLDKGGDETEAAFKTITNTFNTLGQSTAVVKDEVVIMADTMFAKLEEVFGQSPELDALRQKFTALANTMPAVQTSIDNTGNAFDRLHQKHTSTF
jgi:hypothetical protein